MTELHRNGSGNHYIEFYSLKCQFSPSKIIFSPKLDIKNFQESRNNQFHFESKFELQTLIQTVFIRKLFKNIPWFQNITVSKVFHNKLNTSCIHLVYENTAYTQLGKEIDWLV